MMEFLDGVAFAGFLTVAAWFVRAWLRSRDGLLLAFAIAFALFAVTRVLLAATDRDDEANAVIYLLRAGGFGVIIAAVLQRNRTRD